MTGAKLRQVEPTFVIVAVVAAFLAGASWLAFIGPIVGWGIAGLQIGLGLFLIGLFGAIIVMRAHVRSVRLALREDWVSFGAPILGTVSLVVSASRSDWHPIWILQGDMVWNTAQSIFIFEDGGVQGEVHPNPAPLTNILFALFYGSTSDLRSAFASHTCVAIAIIALISLLSSLYASQRTRRLRWFPRFAIVFAVGWLPFTGVLMDPLMRLGHANSLTSLLILWLCWVIYAEIAASRAVQFVLLGFAATAMLASWAPLVVVPLAFGLVVLVKAGRDTAWRPKRLHLILVVGTILQFTLYAILVTMPDLKRDGSALSANGAAALLSDWGALTLALAALLIGARAALEAPAATKQSHDGLALVTVFAVLLPVLIFLMWQRSSAGSLAWGYYPIKLVSLALMLCIPVAITILAGWAVPAATWLRQSVSAGLALPLYLLCLLAYSNWALNANVVAPTLIAAKSIASHEQAESIRDLIEVEARDNESSVSLFYQWGEQDDLADGYLIQLEAETSRDLIRKYAYTFDRGTSESWCEFAVDVPGSIFIYTTLSSATFVSQYLAACPDSADRFTVLNEV